MIYEKDYNLLTDTEKNERVQLEKYIKTGSNIPEKKRDYILGCLSKTLALNDKTIVQISLDKMEDENGYKANGLLTSYLSNYSVSCEIYDEIDGTLFFYTNIVDCKTHNETIAAEKFIKKDELIIHAIQEGENSYNVVNQFLISELNFIETEKGKIK